MWTLILITTLYSSSLHTQHIDGFNSQSKCETALTQIQTAAREARKHGDNLIVSGTCVRVNNKF